MRDPWQMYLQLGIVHFMAFPECLDGYGPQLDTLKSICLDAFFDAVDIGPIHDAVQRRECAVLLRQSQIAVTFACQPLQLRHRLNLNARDALERKRASEAILNCLDQARELGASRFGIMSGFQVPTGERPEALDALANEVRRICRAARDCAGLPVVMEVFDYDVDKKALVGSCKTASTLAELVRRDFPDFGLLHDLSHIYLCHEDPAADLPNIREHLVAMHLGRSVSDPEHPLYGDSHPLFGMDGGDCDIAELRSFLKVIFNLGFLRPGRRPICSFEVKTPDGIDPAITIANVKRTWHQAWWTL